MAALKSNRRILLIGGEGVVLYATSSKGIQREIAIAWAVPDFDHQLSEVLAGQNAGKSIVALFDGADQAYRKEENIPKLSPFDRPRFVKRKLDLAFPSYPIRASLEVKPPKTKGRNKGAGAAPSYLFAALPETENLDRVGESLFESGVPVAGFGLLPVESASLVNALSQTAFGKQGKKKGLAEGMARWSVLIGQDETGGLRQVVVKDGNLALARLTPTSEAGTSGPGWVEEVQKSFKETLAYVSRFGYTPADGLSVIVICGDIEKQFFDLKAIPVAQFKCLNAGEALRMIGVKSFGLEKSNFADALHAAWVAKKKALKLPVRVPSIHRVMAPRLGARIATVAFVLTAMGIAGLAINDYLEYLSIKEDLDNKRNQQTMMQREYDDESKTFAALPVKPDAVKSVLSIKDMLDKNTVDPLPLLAKLRAALGGDISLKTLSYLHTPGDGIGLSPPSPGAPPNERGRLKISFSFALPDSMPLEQKVLRAETLQKSLQQAFSGWDVKIAAQFGRVSRTGQFQGEAGGKSATQDVNDAAQFAMEGPPP